MPNYSISRRRGGSRFAGALPPPGAPDWSLTVVSTTQIDVDWSGLAPAPADRLVYQLRVHATGDFGTLTRTLVDPAPQGGLVPTTSYDFRIGWSDATTTLSEWSDTKTATTLT
jgi:hypothetical protein